MPTKRKRAVAGGDRPASKGPAQRRAAVGAVAPDASAEATTLPSEPTGATLADSPASRGTAPAAPTPSGPKSASGVEREDRPQEPSSGETGRNVREPPVLQNSDPDERS